MNPAPISTDACDINNNDKIDKTYLENRCGVNIERIKSVLAKTDNIFGWLVRVQTTQGTSVLHTPNLYTVENGKFIRSTNKYPREVIYLPGEEVRITVYARFNADNQEYMGEASDQVLSDDEVSLQDQIQSLVTTARSQRNRPYSLPDKSLTYKTDILLADPQIVKSERAQLLEQISRFNNEILNAANKEDSVDISNIELFIKKHHNVLYTSTGINIEFDSTRADAEICFIARFDDGRVAEATARMYARRLQDLNHIEIVRSYSDIARNMAISSSPPQYQGSVVIIGEALADILIIDNNPFVLHCSARSVYDKISRYEQDKPIFGDTEIKGDRITIISDPHIPFGPDSHGFSTIDGSPSRPVTIIKDSNYAELIGTRQYYEYLGLLEQGKLSSGPVGNTVVQAGKVSQADLIGTDKIVAIKMFSSWTVNPMNGDFACEIRLGEIRENGRTTPFKGGMLIGNYFKMFAQVRLSLETIQINNYYGPVAARFENLQVAG